VIWAEGLTTVVTQITNDRLMKNRLAVSPDGTRLLYTEASARDSSGNWVWNIMYLRNASSPAKTPLISDFAYNPSWYEDNSRYLYISYEGGSGRIMRSNVSGGGRTYITHSSIGDSDDMPVIKNGLIACTVWRGGRWQLVTVKENGAEPTFIGDGISPSWHPTQNKIVFTRNGDIFEMTLDSFFQSTQLYTDPQFDCYTPSYSPDGRRILFAKSTVDRTKATSQRDQRHIYVMNADGTNVSPLSSGNSTVFSPSWGKNGEIFCIVGIGNDREIYRLRLRE
jgi:TolB protein